MKYFESVKKGAAITFGRTSFITKKYSPEILIGVGVVSLVTSTVIACKATLRVEEVLDEMADKKALINEASERDLPDYTKKDYDKDITIVAVQTGVKLAKLYGPAAILGTFGVGCILGSHNIMQKRNVAIVAAYNAATKAFTEYRNRVISDVGEDKDREYRYGIKKKKISVSEVGEDGKKKKVKKEINFMDDGAGVSMYARIFGKYKDDANKVPNWDPNAVQYNRELNHAWNPTVIHNKAFLKSQQNFANDLLKTRGHLFLNEVYDMLGFDRTAAGSQVGWVMGGEGDGYVDFGLFDFGRNEYASDYHTDTIGEKRMDFINETVNEVLLDFNVDGVIYNLI